MSLQIKGKFIRSGAIDGDKILLKAGQALRVMAQDGTEKRLIELSAMGKVLVNGEEVALKSQLDAQYASLSASIASEAAARAAKDTELEQMIEAEEQRAIAAEQAEATARAAADAALSAEIAQVRSDLAIETYTRQQADDEFETRLEAERDRALAAEAELRTDIEEVAFSVEQERIRAMAREAELQAEIDAEEAARIAADAAEAATRASEDVRVLSEAKAYTDAKVASEVTDKLGQPNGIATLDANGKLSFSQIPALALTDVFVVQTIAERDALTVEEGDVVKVVQAVQSSSGTMLPRTYIYDGSAFIELSSESDVDSVNGKVGHVVLNTSDVAEMGDSRYFTAAREQEVKQYAEDLADSFGERLAVESFVVNSSIITANFIELPFKAFSASLVVSIDRLLLLESEDYEVSTVDGKTRLTFAGSMLQGQEEALEAGDKIRVRYLKDFR